MYEFPAIAGNKIIIAKAILGENMAIKLVPRDYLIVSTINKWRFCLSRQIKELVGFGTQSACNRRLKKLCEMGLIERKHILYGIPRLYFITPKAKEIFNLEFISKNNVRIDKILHDILLIDTVIYFIKNKKIDLTYLKSERELRHTAGFSNSKHYPDFLFQYNSKNYCVEIELSVKNFTYLTKNVSENYKNYDGQIWIIDFGKLKLIDNLNKLKKDFDIYIIDSEVIKNYIKML